MSGGTALAAALAFAVQVALARRLSKEEFGALTAAYLLATVVGFFGFQGVGEIAMRHPRSMDSRRVWGGAGVMFLVGITTTTIWMLTVGLRQVPLPLMAAMLLFAFTHVGLLAGMVAGQIRHDPVAIAGWPVLLQVGRLVPLPLVFLIDASPTTIALAWGVAMIPLATRGVRRFNASLGTACTKDDAPDPRESWLPPSSIRELVHAATPFSIARTMEFAEYLAPVILTTSLISTEAAGEVAAALVIVQGLLLIPIAIFPRLLRPRFHQWAVDSPRRLRRSGVAGVAAALLVGLPGSLVVWSFPAAIMAFVFGEPYAAGSGVLGRLAMVVPVWSAAIAVNATLVTPKTASGRTMIQIGGLVLMISIPLASPPGLRLEGILIGVASNQLLQLITGVAMLLRIPDHPNSSASIVEVPPVG